MSLKIHGFAAQRQYEDLVWKPRCTTVRFSLSGWPGVNLDAHNSFGNKGESQIWLSDLFELEVEKRKKMLAEGQAPDIDF
jgi:hypothetical protein